MYIAVEEMKLESTTLVRTAESQKYHGADKINAGGRRHVIVALLGSNSNLSVS